MDILFGIIFVFSISGLAVLLFGLFIFGFMIGFEILERLWKNKVLPWITYHFGNK